MVVSEPPVASRVALGSTTSRSVSVTWFQPKALAMVAMRWRLGARSSSAMVGVMAARTSASSKVTLRGW